jgi:hypothetical protein
MPAWSVFLRFIRSVRSAPYCLPSRRYLFLPSGSQREWLARRDLLLFLPLQHFSSLLRGSASCSIYLPSLREYYPSPEPLLSRSRLCAIVLQLRFIVSAGILHAKKVLFPSARAVHVEVPCEYCQAPASFQLLHTKLAP